MGFPQARVSSGNILHFSMESSTGCSVNICSSMIFPKAGGKLCSSTWSTSSLSFFSHLSAHRVVSHTFFVPPVYCFLPFLSYVFLGMPPAWLMGSTVSCGTSIVELAVLHRAAPDLFWHLGVAVFYKSVPCLVGMELIFSIAAWMELYLWNCLHLYDISAFDSFPYPTGGVRGLWVTDRGFSCRPGLTHHKKSGFFQTGGPRKTAAHSFCWVRNLCFMYR